MYPIRYLYDEKHRYDLVVRELEIVQSSFHGNGRAAPFVAAIIDDPEAGDTKIVIMFDEPDYTAVLSLDTLCETEDIAEEAHKSRGDIFDEALRENLWYQSEDY